MISPSELNNLTTDLTDRFDSDVLQLAALAHMMASSIQRYIPEPHVSRALQLHRDALAVYLTSIGACALEFERAMRQITLAAQTAAYLNSIPV